MKNYAIWEDEIERLLETCTIEEALEAMDITPHECIEALLKHGYVKLPPWIKEDGPPS